MGIDTQKSVSDMWNYQEIIFELKPSLIIEFGTYKGGATLFFSNILQFINPKSKVLTVDINDNIMSPLVKNNPHIEILIMSSTSPRVKERIRALQGEYPGRVFAILDSDHTKSHVIAEIELLSSILKPGDYLIVEDSNINGNPVLPGWGEGPMEAIMEYFEKYPDHYYHDIDREIKFGFTFAPNGYLIRK
jgi:cephalosporin hydroxylase